MSRKRFVVWIVWSLMAFGLVWGNGWRDLRTLATVAALFSGCVAGPILWRLANAHAGMNSQRGLSQDDTFFATLFHGGWTGLVVLAVLASGVFVSRYLLTEKEPVAATGIGVEENAQQVGRFLPSSVARFDVVATFFRAPTLQVDAVSDGNANRLVDAKNMVLLVGDRVVEVDDVFAIDHEDRLNVLILRDRSGSTSAEPFPTFMRQATEMLRRLPDAGRKCSACVSDFAGDLVVAAPWTDDPRGVKSDFASPSVAGTNLYGSLARAMDDLGQRQGSRVLVLISDGINGVASNFSLAGLSAYARSKRVVLHTVVLPCDKFDHEFMTALAVGTGGKCVRADTGLEELFEALNVREIRPAFRFVGRVPSFSPSDTVRVMRRGEEKRLARIEIDN